MQHAVDVFPSYPSIASSNDLHMKGGFKTTYSFDKPSLNSEHLKVDDLISYDNRKHKKFCGASGQIL
uniref:Uncharacterized protein n=1 Tax=Romanomermis culicivorax TaxID=13658 RepID=A0A915KNF6_ROMCU